MKTFFTLTRLIIISAILVFISLANFRFAQAAVQWGEVLSNQAQHDANIPGTNNSHFTRQWRTDGWNGTEGYYRWTLLTQNEDDDGYYLDHPNTNSNNLYASFIMRVGPDWSSHFVGGEFKFAMFYPASEPPPYRPTIFNWHTAGGHRTFLTCTNANGDGCRDEFGNQHPSGNHQYQEGPGGHNQWYFVVMGLVNDHTELWIYSQDGTIAGHISNSDTRSWSTTWSVVRLLAYITPTQGGSANAYIDMGRISVTQTLPSPPTGFVSGVTPPPPPPTPSPTADIRANNSTSAISITSG